MPLMPLEQHLAMRKSPAAETEENAPWSGDWNYLLSKDWFGKLGGEVKDLASNPRALIEGTGNLASLPMRSTNPFDSEARTQSTDVLKGIISDAWETLIDPARKWGDSPLSMIADVASIAGGGATANRVRKGLSAQKAAKAATDAARQAELLNSLEGDMVRDISRRSVQNAEGDNVVAMARKYGTTGTTGSTNLEADDARGPMGRMTSDLENDAAEAMRSKYLQSDLEQQAFADINSPTKLEADAVADMLRRKSTADAERAAAWREMTAQRGKKMPLSPQPESIWGLLPSSSEVKLLPAQAGGPIALGGDVAQRIKTPPRVPGAPVGPFIFPPTAVEKEAKLAIGEAQRRAAQQARESVIRGLTGESAVEAAVPPLPKLLEILQRVGYTPDEIARMSGAERSAAWQSIATPKKKSLF